MHNDKQNSVIAISDTAGNPVVRRGYGTYGETNPAQITGPTAHPFGYTGRRWDNDLGLYYYRARWYDPQLGTFLQTDPIGSLDYVNLYSYVGLEPGNGTDPTGMWIALSSRGWDVKNLTPEQEAQSQRETEQAIDIVSTIAPPLRSFRPAIAAARTVARFNPRQQPVRTCCFVAGTKVQTKEGLRSVESLKVGDLVLSKDEFRGMIAWKPVTALIRRHQREIWAVSFDEARGNGNQSGKHENFGTTDDHPWRTAAGTWVRTDELTIGLRIQRADGTLATVRTVSKTNRVENTFNLEVADFHTYFVGELAVWVHNACAYTVPGSRTRSGQNYHGSTKEADPAQRSGNGRDGRRREPGDTTQQMPNSTRREREVQEQVQINADGGLGKVDNARNPVAPSKWEKYGIPPPR